MSTGVTTGDAVLRAVARLLSILSAQKGSVIKIEGKLVIAPPAQLSGYLALKVNVLLRPTEHATIRQSIRTSRSREIALSGEVP
jgi:GGDEF domain-containing protein